MEKLEKKNDVLELIISISIACLEIVRRLKDVMGSSAVVEEDGEGKW